MVRIGPVAFVIAHRHPFPILAVGFAVGAEGVHVAVHPGDGASFVRHAAEHQRVGILGRNQAAIAAVRGMIDCKQIRRVQDGGESAVFRIVVAGGQPSQQGRAALAVRHMAELKQSHAPLRLGVDDLLVESARLADLAQGVFAIGSRAEFG